MDIEKVNKYAFTIIAALSIGLLCTGIISMYYTTLKIYDSVTDGISIDLMNIKDKYDYGDIKEFAILAGRFADSHNYSDEYNCINYTSDLYRISQQLGFDVIQMRGCDDNMSDCHRWLKLLVDFEPQDGVFVDYSKKYTFQEEVLQ